MTEGLGLLGKDGALAPPKGDELVLGTEVEGSSMTLSTLTTGCTESLVIL